jgi:hypothetical protein
MAAPTQPSINSVTIEALKLAGYTGAAADDAVQTLSEQWLEQLFNEIWLDSRKKLKTLMTEDINVIEDGERKIICPDDFASHIEMELLEGTHYGTVASGSSTTQFNLQSGEDASNSSSEGDEIIVYLTATKSTAYSSYITDISSEVATVSPALPVTPTSSYSYLIVDTSTKLEQRHLNRLDDITRGTPDSYYPAGEIYDSDGSSKFKSRQDAFYLDPVPRRTDGKPWAIRNRYYSDLMRLDRSDSNAADAMVKILREWRAALVEGLKWKHYEYRDDERQTTQLQIWNALKQRLISSETYGNELNEIQTTVDV